MTDIPYHSPLQPYGAYFGIVFFVFLTLINGFSCFWPQKWSASSFLTNYIGIPIFLVIYFAHRIYAMKEPWARDSMTVDLKTGLEEVEAAETPLRVYDTWYKKLRVVFE